MMGRVLYLCNFTDGATQLTVGNNTFLNDFAQPIPHYTQLLDLIVVDPSSMVNNVLRAKLAEGFHVRISHEVG